MTIVIQDSKTNGSESRLTQVSDPSGNYSFTYDNLGRLTGTGTQYSFLSTALNNSYGYDAVSNRVSFTNPQSQITNYSYDSLNRFTGLTDPNTGTFGFAYDALGRRTSLTRPNGVGTSYSYDTLSRLLSVLHGGGSLPGSTSYSYDAAGNRLTKTAVQEASPNPVSVTSQFSYDNIYELTQTVVGGNLAESYSYDAVGNRLSSAGPTSYNYNTSNELTSTSAATYAYDNNGNTTSKTTTAGTTSYTWDFENRLASVTLPGTGGTASFDYDPFGRRIRKIAPSETTIYVYDGPDVIQELGASGNLLASYTQGTGVDEALAQYQGPNTTYFHADGLGSINSLTDSAGNLAASYVYDSFGNVTASTGTINNLFQYTAREFDSETGLYYYRARYFDPAIGRFLSQDPVRFDGGVNFYAYVLNNPASLIDSSGLTTETNAAFLWGWWNGLLPNTINYGPNDVEAKEMAKGVGANKLRQFFYKKNCKNVTHYDYGIWRAGWNTVVNPFTADWGSTAAQVGAWGPASATNNGNGTVTFVIENTAGAHSFFLHAVSDVKDPTGPRSNIFQTFRWTEPIPANCGCH